MLLKFLITIFFSDMVEVLEVFIHLEMIVMMICLKIGLVLQATDLQKKLVMEVLSCF